MLLIVGCKGQLGTELGLILEEEFLEVDLDNLDITNEELVKEFFETNKIDLVINCAGYTNVEKAETEVEKANLVNVKGVANLAKYGKNIIHISTDYVFDGSKCTPYVETDKTNPLSAYGKSKLLGEEAVLKEAQKAVILRTCWLYSPYGHNFVKTMLKHGQHNDELKVVFDQIGTPTYAKDLAMVICEIISSDIFETRDNLKEIYHFSDEGVCSWYDFAKAIMEESNINCKIIPIESKDFPSKVNRPSYSVLNKRKIKEAFNLEIPHWRDSLRTCMGYLR